MIYAKIRLIVFDIKGLFRAIEIGGIATWYASGNIFALIHYITSKLLFVRTDLSVFDPNLMNH